MGRFGVGQGLRRVEDLRFLTGEGQYSDDIRLEGQCHGVLVRSPFAHATIASIDLAEAKAAPGVLGVFTVDDLDADGVGRSEEHTSELQSLMRISSADFCLKKKTKLITHTQPPITSTHN